MSLKNYKALTLLTILAACTTVQDLPQQETSQKLKEIVIGDVNTNLSEKEYLKHYYNGMDMAVAEINSKGGVLGLPIRVIKKNDFGNYTQSYMEAKNLDTKEGALILSGTYLPQTAQAVARYAKENNMPFLNTGTPTESIFKQDLYSPYVFRLRSGVDENINGLIKVIVQDSQIKTFSILTYSNEEGDYISSQIKEKLKAQKEKAYFMPDIRVAQFKATQFDVANKVYDNRSQGLIIAVNGIDIQNLTLMLEQSKTTINKKVYILYAGEPEWLDSLGEYTPENWITTGFPWYAIDTKENLDFYNKYQNTYKAKPRYASYLGYSSVYVIAAAIKKANIYNNDQLNKQALITALEQTSVITPMGNITMDKNHKSNAPVYVGLLSSYNTEKKQYNKTNRKLDVRMFNSEKIN
jgi:branched-chain amino acid transport system substrate-binding protein